MNMFKDCRPLASLFLLLAVPAIASEEAPSTPPRKRLRPDNSCVTPPRIQRRRLMPGAPSRERFSIANSPQGIVNQIEECLGDYKCVRYKKDRIERILNRFILLSMNNPNLNGLTGQSRKSIAFMLSEQQEIRSLFDWFWAMLPGDMKQHEVQLQAENKATLFHNVAKNGLPSTIFSVSQLHQDFLRSDEEGRLAVEYIGPQYNPNLKKDLLKRVHGQAVGRVDWLKGVVDSTSLGSCHRGAVPEAVSKLIASMIVGDMGPGFRA